MRLRTIACAHDECKLRLELISWEVAYAALLQMWTDFRGRVMSALRQPAQDSTEARLDFDKSLKKYAVLLIAAVLGIWVADGNYPPLDEKPFIVSALALWVVGCVLMFLSIGRSAYNIGLVRGVLAFVGPVLILLSAFVILNGALDHYPLVQADTRVVRTYLAGRYGTKYNIVVSPSWRQGRNQETFQVYGDFYRDLQPGDLVRVEIHRGAFWLPWGPAVINRMR
jgi:hypothetical protein